MEKIRVQKLIADSGYCSRRKAEELIENKQVKVNGRLVSLGDKALPKDDIIVSGEHLYINRKKQYTYIMLHKPAGVISATEDAEDRTVLDLIAEGKKGLFPVGRLDKDSEGLLLVTNNGDIINQIMRAGNYHEKEYLVTVDKPVTEEFVDSALLS